MRKVLLLIPVLVTFAIAACSSPSTLRVTNIQLGRSQNADRTVTDSTTGFSPHDTVYLSVLTAGKGSATISVRWTYAGRTIDEPKKQVHYNDIAVTDFSLQSTSSFPPGDYTAEVFVDGKSAGVRNFHVRP